MLQNTFQKKQAVTALIQLALKEKIISRKQFHLLKNRISAEYKIPHLTNLELLEGYTDLIATKKILPQPHLEKLLRKREIRTLSGIAPVAVLTKPSACPGKCVFCPTEKTMPKSYLSNEPAVMRAILNEFDPYRQVLNRLQALHLTGHKTVKAELIVMGGTFNYFSPQYQTSFIKRCFQGLNAKINLSAKIQMQKGRNFYQIKEQYLKPPTHQTLAEAQKLNEKAAHRCVGLTLETRPDYINEKALIRFRKLGCTKIEIGVQSLDNVILKLNQRGHTVEQTVSATRLMKDAGFKVCYHLMPNLPGADLRKDLQMFQGLFTNPNFQPDLLKIYPCVVTEFAELAVWWRQGKYQPYTDAELLNLLLAIKQTLPSYVRVIRVIRDIPAESILAGSKISNLRQLLQEKMEKEGIKCQCIRCREIRGQKFDARQLELARRDYPASQGQEIFLSFEDKKQNKLISMLRLRIPSQIFSGAKHFMPELNGCALIRELHTYGEQTLLGQIGVTQHLGFGKRLLKAAERIARQEFGLRKMAVIAGIGARAYYRKYGYELAGTYMVKKL